MKMKNLDIIGDFLTLAQHQFRVGQLSFEAYNEAKALALLMEHCVYFPAVALAGKTLAYNLLRQDEEKGDD